MVSQQGRWERLRPEIPHPVNGDFGATVFASNPGSYNAMAAHSQYWDRNNIARNGMARIIVGDGETLR